MIQIKIIEDFIFKTIKDEEIRESLLEILYEDYISKGNSELPIKTSDDLKRKFKRETGFSAYCDDEINPNYIHWLENIILNPENIL